MSSGVQVNPMCQTLFQQMAEGKNNYRYIIFKILDKEVVVEKSVKSDELASACSDDYADNSKAAYEEFLKDLKTITDGFNDCRYAVFDFKFSSSREGAGTSKIAKIVFLQLCPDDAPVKKRMVYASSANAIKDALGTGRIIPLQVSDEAGMNHKDLLDKLLEKCRA